MKKDRDVSMMETMVELQHQLDMARYQIAETQASYEEYVTMMARKEKYEKLLIILKQL